MGGKMKRKEAENKDQITATERVGQMTLGEDERRGPEQWERDPETDEQEGFVPLLFVFNYYLFP